MMHRTPAASLALLAAIAALVAAPTHAADKPGAKAWKVPRTADGHPDLQGIWSNVTLTPVERPAQFGDRKTLTEEEARVIEGRESDYVSSAAKPSDPNKKEVAGVCTNFQFGCGYNNFWIDRGSQVITIDGERRSSVLIDPPNGRVPPLTAQRRSELGRRGSSFDGPEGRPLAERCLLSFGSSSGPPMLPVLYNNHQQIVQTKDTIVILVEMVHDARIVRMSDKHLPASMRKWMGDSIGRWEGDTLVVETTNFTDKESYRGSSEHKKVTERFTRIAPDTMLYKFTVEDPAFTQPFTGEVPFYLTDDNIYEYACHEGNYALPGILAGAREAEKAGKKATDEGGEAE
jgi:hypothetical protein